MIKKLLFTIVLLTLNVEQAMSINPDAEKYISKISRSFYDVDDKLIDSIMSEGFDLLSPEGKVFITSSMRTLEQIKELCTKYSISYKIIREEDLHADGNMHYIIELSCNSNDQK